jgi:flavin reductase (DIM6/NTAB) family NADH-FMN oxidoreductase RutF
MQMPEKQEPESIEYTRTGKPITPTDRALDKILSGLAVITTCCEKTPYGMTAAWFTRASNEPYMVTVSVWEKNYTHEKLLQSNNYAINILSEKKKDLAVHFGRQSGRDIDKFLNIAYQVGESGAPILIEDCLAYLDCRIVDSMNAGDHTIFLGRVVKAEILKEHDPLVYDRRDFP